MERFSRRPRDLRVPPPSVFKAMSEGQWMRWGYLHVDHHLRQSGSEAADFWCGVSSMFRALRSEQRSTVAKATVISEPLRHDRSRALSKSCPL